MSQDVWSLLCGSLWIESDHTFKHVQVGLKNNLICPVIVADVCKLTDNKPMLVSVATVATVTLAVAFSNHPPLHWPAFAVASVSVKLHATGFFSARRLSPLQLLLLILLFIQCCVQPPHDGPTLHLHFSAFSRRRDAPVKMTEMEEDIHPPVQFLSSTFQDVCQPCALLLFVTRFQPSPAGSLPLLGSTPAPSQQGLLMAFPVVISKIKACPKKIRLYS